jgi:hypothetical protein
VYHKADGTSHELKLHLSVEDGGIIQLSEDDIAKHGYTINGFIQDSAISFKVQWTADQKEVEFNGEFDEVNHKQINGDYKNGGEDQSFDAEG